MDDLSPATAPPDPARPARPAGATAYGWYVLGILFLIYVFNCVDRSIVSILGQPIKEEMNLADWQLGLLGGLAFSALYVVAGVPLSRLADRGNRVRLIALCLAAWSAMTALCGASANFVQLLLFRMGVGIGEAGGMPTSHSLIADYFPRHLRTTALSIFGLGLPIGGLVGMVVGGVVVDRWGWRAAFLLVGLPGVLLAILTWLAVREPVRGGFDAAPRPSADDRGPGYAEMLRLLRRNPASRHILIALTAAMLVSSPNAVFLAPYLVRRFALSYTEIGVVLGSTLMVGTAISTLAGGLIAEWAGRRGAQWYLRVPAISMIASGPLFAAAYASPSWAGLAAGFFVASLIGAAYLAPCFAVLHNIVPPRGRATTVVISQFLINLVGLGAGPIACGYAIDLLAGGFFGAGHGGSFAALCQAARPGSLAAETALACQSALSRATRLALGGSSALMIWPGIHLWIAARTLREPSP